MAVASLFPLEPWAQAQTQTQVQPAIEEVWVYAQKRTQNQQIVPVAVTAFSGERLETSGVEDMFDLGTIGPGLEVRQGGSASGVRFRIRSICSKSDNFGIESSVGLYVDGVYRARQGSLINNMVDVERVEVLHGPQGTLFGRNTLAGAVLMNTVAHSHDGRDGVAEVTLGNYDLLNVSGATSLSAIDEVLAFRAAAFSTQRDGYVDDIMLGSNTIYDRNRWGIRLQGLHTPTDSLSVRVIADYSEIDEICCASLVVQDNLRPVALPPGATTYAGSDEVVRSLDGTVLTGDRFYDFVTAQNLLPVSATDDSGVSVTVDWDLEAFSLISITGYRAFDAHESYDADFSDLNSLASETTVEQSAWTQELRIHGDGAQFSYVAGLYYFAQELDNVSLLRLDEDINGVFSHTFAYYPGTNGQFPLEDIASFPLPSLPLFQPGSGARNSMKQHHEAYAVFGQADYDLTDALKITAAYAATRGEVEDWQNDICWVAARFHTGRPDPGDPTNGENTTGCDRSGDDLAFNPDQLVITAHQRFDVSEGVDGFLRVEYSYLGETELQSGDPFLRIPPSTLVHARLGFRFGNYDTDLTFWGRNILDEEHRMAGFDPLGQEGRVVATPLEPATWGITLRTSF